MINSIYLKAMNKLILLLSFLIFVTLINGQTEEKVLLNKGVEAFNNKEYGKALNYFNEGYAKNGDYNASLFNSANAAFLNDSIRIAKDLFAEYTTAVESKIDKSKGFYNLGNVQYKEYENISKNPEKSKEAIKALKESIDSYKKALRNNPQDKDARHNLSLAMSKLPLPSENQDENGGENEENKDGEGENKEEQNDENKDGENKDDQQNKEGDKKEEGDKGDQKEKGDKGDEKKEGENGNPEEKKEEQDKKDEQKAGKDGDQEKNEEEMKGQISRVQATKDLDAMNNDEQKILMKVNRKKGDEQKQNSSSKDW